MANKLTTDAELQQVANAIRSKGGTSAALGYPGGMVTAIGNLNVGTDLSPAASAADIRNGKKAVVNRQTLTGSMTEKAAATYNTSSSDQSIASGQYLTGAQTIKAVTTSNLSAANIKAGVTVKVGDANDDDRIAGVTGTFTADADASASQIAKGKTAYVNGEKITGTRPILYAGWITSSACHVTLAQSAKTIAAGGQTQPDALGLSTLVSNAMSTALNNKYGSGRWEIVSHACYINGGAIYDGNTGDYLGNIFNLTTSYAVHSTMSPTGYVVTNLDDLLPSQSRIIHNKTASQQTLPAGAYIDSYIHFFVKYW